MKGPWFRCLGALTSTAEVPYTSSLAQSAALFETNLTMEVVPPNADALLVSPSQTVLVPSDGAAAAAGYQSQQLLSVALRFPGWRTISNLTDDARVNYQVVPSTAPTGTLEVGVDGCIRSASAGLNLAGTAEVLVTFQGENVKPQRGGDVNEL